ncbi:porin [Enterovibrio sp. 27052020O]|uniref:porin n=1 Tax=Enterovibrio sp. 27052020O TaxID=3241166 RepID=UPI00389085AC
MKKTILAMAVPALLAAGAAQASVNLYDADGVVVNIAGAAEIQYINKYDVRAPGASGKDAYLRIDDADLILTTTIAVTDSLNAVAGMGFKYEADTVDNGGVESDELYVGLGGDFGTFTFGRQLLLSDDAGNSHDYELGTEQIDFVQTQGAQVAKWVYDNGMFYAGANIDLDSDVSEAKDGRQIIGGRLGVRVADLDARVYLYDGENLQSNKFAVVDKDSGLQDVSGFNLEVDYDLGDFDVSASYGQLEYKAGSVDTAGVAQAAGKNDVDKWQISGGYQLDDNTYFGLGYDNVDSDASGTYEKYKGSSIYANVTYKLATNAKVYAEVGSADVEIAGVDQDTDTGYLVGMEVKF